jgi:hypothetical protein
LTYSKLNRDREEVDAGSLGDGLTAGNTRQVDVARLNKALLALGSAENLLGESKVFKSVFATCIWVTGTLPETGVSHRQSSGTSTVLGLDDLVTTKLDTVDKSLVLVGGDLDSRVGLADEGQDGLARVATDNGDGQLLGLGLADNLGNKGLGTDNVEGGDTKEALGVEDLLGLEDLGGDGDGGVDGVGDDEDEGLGGNLGNDLDQALDDASVDVEEVITGHTRLAYEQCGVSNCNVAVAVADYTQSHAEALTAPDGL